jgi:hypothetical protein
VQTIIPLGSNNGALRLTTARYDQKDLRSFRSQVQAGTMANDDRNYIINLCQRLQQLQPRRSLSGFGDSPAIRQRSVIGFGHGRVLSVGNYQLRMWFRGQSCARGTVGMG